ncbi:hypothetical protein V8C86DRAFT_1390675 [Haematococcus lacustris]
MAQGLPSRPGPLRGPTRPSSCMRLGPRSPLLILKHAPRSSTTAGRWPRHHQIPPGQGLQAGPAGRWPGSRPAPRPEARDGHGWLLTFLRKYTLEQLSREVGAAAAWLENIHWCLTVPAMWSEGSKALMRTAALRAGLIRTANSDALTIILEPEAAALHALDKQAPPLVAGTSCCHAWRCLMVHALPAHGWSSTAMLGGGHQLMTMRESRCSSPPGCVGSMAYCPNLADHVHVGDGFGCGWRHSTARSCCQRAPALRGPFAAV